MNVHLLIYIHIGLEYFLEVLVFDDTNWSGLLLSCSYVPSQADIAVFDALSGTPPADLCHALRWYNHIKSYQKEKAR